MSKCDNTCGTKIIEINNTTVDITNLSENDITNLLNQFNFTDLTAEQCQDIFQCIINNGTIQQFVEFLQKLDFSQMTAQQCADILACIDFTNLTPIQCQAILDCIITNITPAQITELTNVIDFTTLINNLTPTEQAALCQAIIDAGCDLTELIDFTQLSTQQQTDLTNLIESLNLTLLTVTAGATAAAGDNSNGQEVVSIGDTIHFWSSDDTIDINVSAGSAIVDLTVDPISHPEGSLVSCLEDSPLLNNDGGSPNSYQYTTTFTPHITGEYDLNYSVGSFSGGGSDPSFFINVGTSAGASDVFNGGGTRSLQSSPSVTTTITLTQNVEYFFTGLAGGGSIAGDITSCISQKGLSQFIETATESTELWATCIDCYTQNAGISTQGNPVGGGGFATNEFNPTLGVFTITPTANIAVPEFFKIRIEDASDGDQPLEISISGSDGSSATATGVGPQSFDNGMVDFSIAFGFVFQAGVTYTFTPSTVNTLPAGDVVTMFAVENSNSDPIDFLSDSSDGAGGNIPELVPEIIIIAESDTTAKVITLSDNSLKFYDESLVEISGLTSVPPAWQRCGLTDVEQSEVNELIQELVPDNINLNTYISTNFTLNPVNNTDIATRTHTWTGSSPVNGTVTIPASEDPSRERFWVINDSPNGTDLVIDASALPTGLDDGSPSIIPAGCKADISYGEFGDKAYVHLTCGEGVLADYNTPSVICKLLIFDPVSNGEQTGIASLDGPIPPNQDHYLMYTLESKDTRFVGSHPSANKNLVGVYWDGANWLVEQSSAGSDAVFTPVDTDVLVSEILTTGTPTAIAVAGNVNGIQSVENNGGLLFAANQFNGAANTGEIDIIGGQLDTGVVEKSYLQLDGTYLLPDGSFQSVSDVVADNWIVCSDEDLDNSGVVTTAVTALTTTNGVNINIGDDYIEFPDGTTWATGSASASGVNSVIGEHVDNTDSSNPIVKTWIKEECFLEAQLPVAAIASSFYDNRIATTGQTLTAEGSHIGFVGEEFRVDLSDFTAPLIADQVNNDWYLRQVILDRTGAPFNASNTFNLSLISSDGTIKGTSANASLANVGPTIFNFTQAQNLKVEDGDYWRFGGGANFQGQISSVPDIDGRWETTGDDPSLSGGPFQGAAEDLDAGDALPMSFAFEQVGLIPRILRTYDDGSLYQIDKTTNTATLVVSIPTNWVEISCDQDITVTGEHVSQEGLNIDVKTWIKEECYDEAVFTLASDASGASGGDTTIAAVLGQGNGGQWTVPAGTTYNTVDGFGNHFHGGVDGVVDWQITNTTTGQIINAVTNYIAADGTIGGVDGGLNVGQTGPYTFLPSPLFVSAGDVVNFVITSDTTGANWRRSQPLGTVNDADWAWLLTGQVNKPSFALYSNDPNQHVVRTYNDGSIFEVNKTTNTVSEVTSIPTSWNKSSCLTDDEVSQINDLIESAIDDSSISTQFRKVCFSPTDTFIAKSTIYEHYTLEDEVFISLGYSSSNIYNSANLVDITTLDGGGSVSVGECPCCHLDYSNISIYNAFAAAGTITGTGKANSSNPNISFNPAVGATQVETIEFFSPVNNKFIDVEASVTRVSGSGDLVFNTAISRWTLSSPAAVFDLTMKVVDSKFGIDADIDWSFSVSSVGGGDLVNFVTPIDDYIQNAGAPNLTLPYTGNWSNGNNNASSSMRMSGYNEVSLRFTTANAVNFTMSMALLSGPSIEEFDTCSLTGTDSWKSFVSRLEDSGNSCTPVDCVEVLGDPVQIIEVAGEMTLQRAYNVVTTFVDMTSDSTLLTADVDKTAQASALATHLQGLAGVVGVVTAVGETVEISAPAGQGTVSSVRFEVAPLELNFRDSDSPVETVLDTTWTQTDVATGQVVEVTFGTADALSGPTSGNGVVMRNQIAGVVGNITTSGGLVPTRMRSQFNDLDFGAGTEEQMSFNPTPTSADVVNGSGSLTGNVFISDVSNTDVSIFSDGNNIQFDVLSDMSSNRGIGVRQVQLFWDYDAVITEVQGPVTQLVKCGDDFLDLAGNVVAAPAEYLPCGVYEYLNGFESGGGITVTDNEDGSYTICNDTECVTIDICADIASYCGSTGGVDTFGAVVNATAAITTTNGVSVAIGEDYIEFPDGTTWSNAIWTVESFSTDTTTTGVNDVHHRFAASATAPVTLTIGGAGIYNPVGSRKQISNNNPTHAVTVVVDGFDLLDYAQDTNGPVSSLTINAGETYELTKNAGERWTVTGKYPDNSGEVLVSANSFTSTNNENVNIGDEYISFPNGDTWFSPDVLPPIGWVEQTVGNGSTVNGQEDIHYIYTDAGGIVNFNSTGTPNSRWQITNNGTGAATFDGSGIPIVNAPDGDEFTLEVGQSALLMTTSTGQNQILNIWPDSGAWTFGDFNSATQLTDGLGDKVWRFNAGVATPINSTLTIDRNAHASGQRLVVINNHSDPSSILTLAINNGGEFSDTGSGGITVPTISIATGERYTLVRNTGGFWTVTSKYPESGASSGGGSIVEGSFTGTANQTQNFGNFAQNWFDFDLLFQTSTGQGQRSALILEDGQSQLRHFTGVAGVESTLNMQDSFSQLQYNTGGQVSSWRVDADGLVLVTGGGDLRVNFNAGTSGQQLTSQGAGNAPIWGAASDKRVKKNIKTLTDTTNRLSGIRGVSFEYKNDGAKTYGVIAQEVEVDNPDLIQEQENGSIKDFKTVDYNGITALLVEEVKSLREDLKAAQNEIKKLKN